jgi:hypothetical protein
MKCIPELGDNVQNSKNLQFPGSMPINFSRKNMFTVQKKVLNEIQLLSIRDIMSQKKLMEFDI